MEGALYAGPAASSHRQEGLQIWITGGFYKDTSGVYRVTYKDHMRQSTASGILMLDPD